MFNSQILSQIRSGKASLLRGDIDSFLPKSISFTCRDKGVPPGGPGTKVDIESDIIVLATGFYRPDPYFMPPEIFQPAILRPPAWYQQIFPPDYPR